MDVETALSTLQAQLKKQQDWQITAIFTTEAVQALVDYAIKQIGKENTPPTNYYGNAG